MKNSKLLLLLTLCVIPQWAVAAGEPRTWSRLDTERAVLAGIFIFLLLIILALGKSLQAAVQVKNERERRKKDKTNILPFIAFFGSTWALSNTAMAQDLGDAAPKTPFIFSTVPGDILVMLLIIIIQIVIIFVMARMQWQLLTEPTAKAVKKRKINWNRLFEKFNDTVPMERQAELDMQHDYDGIRELDNKIPRWWTASFIGTILIGVVYLYMMFVSGSIPDQFEELDEAYRIAAIQKEKYLRNAANNVDEHTVVMLDASGIEAGRILYTEKGCGACHGDVGQGNAIGPNLTDEYWLHKGSINDIFYSIKYGWPDKGMIAWESQLSPVQIAQVASYIKSLQGSNPPDAKEPQGEKYVEDDEASNPSDSTQSQQPEAQIAVAF